jgi:alpha-glucosidase/alpha-D-xyloside xylohydrolase
MPIIRSLWFHYPGETDAVARGDEYLYGRDILVAPVIEKGAASRTLYLPNGAWYDFWTGEETEGGREITRKVEGPFTLWVHPGADGTFSLYEDDGRSFDFRKGAFMRLNIAWNDRQRRHIVVKAAGESVTRDLIFQGRPVDVKL